MVNVPPVSTSDIKLNSHRPESWVEPAAIVKALIPPMPFGRLKAHMVRKREMHSKADLDENTAENV